MEVSVLTGLIKSAAGRQQKPRAVALVCPKDLSSGLVAMLFLKKMNLCKLCVVGTSAQQVQRGFCFIYQLLPNHPCRHVIVHECMASEFGRIGVVAAVQFFWYL
jgi:hypothetical protein